MTAIFFFVVDYGSNNHQLRQAARESQIAYKILMSSNFKFKPIEIKGKNVANTLKKYGINKVPTLYLQNKRAKVEGAEGIAKYLGFQPERPKYQKSIREPSPDISSPDLSSEYESESDMDSLERSLQENPIVSEEEEFEEESRSDEISLDI